MAELSLVPVVYCVDESMIFLEAALCLKLCTPLYQGNGRDMIFYFIDTRIYKAVIKGLTFV